MDEIAAMIAKAQRTLNGLEPTCTEVRMNKRFDEVDKRLDGVDIRFDGVDKRIEDMDARFTKRMDKMDQRFERIEKQMELQKITMDEVLRVVNAISHNLIVYNAKLDGTIKKTAEIDERVTVLESGFQSISEVASG